ncbi:hypothetical protein J0689_25255, partial [Vibrio parahaemolyticus]|uniref:hypothetical protein n=1 Tax=Vibrio parahaemolyticus TaxID=670 RepID=UPI001A9034CB
MVTGTLEEESLDIHGVIGLHLTNSFGDCAPPSQLPRSLELVAISFGKQTTVGSGGFFCLRQLIYAVTPYQVKT